MEVGKTGNERIKFGKQQKNGCEKGVRSMKIKNWKRKCCNLEKGY